jgi:hypothetical protein
MTTEHPAQRRQFARNVAKHLFFLVFVVGAAAIIGLELYGVDKVPATLACCALIVLYALIAMILPGAKVRADQIGDNCYYLGLLFTLTSLAMALFRFTDNPTGLTLTIIRSFGIAIGTTIVGLMLRVFISQFRDDPDYLEQEARTALNETVRRIRGQLDEALSEMKSFSVGVSQVLNEVGETARTSTASSLDTAVARFLGAVDKMAGQLEASTSGFVARTDAFDAGVTKMVGALEGLTTRVDGIKADASLVEEAVRPAFQALEAATTDFATAIGQQRTKFDRTFKAISKVAESSEALGNTGEALKGAAEELKRGVDAMRLGFDALEHYKVNAAAAVQNTDQFIASLAAAAKKLDDGADEAARRVLSVAQESADHFRTMRNDLEASHNNVERVRRELAELAGWIIAKLEAAR